MSTMTTEFWIQWSGNVLDFWPSVDLVSSGVGKTEPLFSPTAPHPQPQLTKEGKRLGGGVALGYSMLRALGSTPSNQWVSNSPSHQTGVKVLWEPRRCTLHTGSTSPERHMRWHHSNGNSALKDNTLCLAFNRCPPRRSKALEDAKVI